MKKKKTSKIANISTKTTVDNKLTLAALQLSYAFEYGVDFQSRIITITDEIKYPWFDIIDVSMTQMERESRKSITVKINSYGGDTYEAMSIVARLRESACRIVTVGYGQVLSAATLILACGDKRRFSKYGQFMHHEAVYNTGWEKHTNIKALTRQVDKEEKMWCEAMEEFSNRDARFWLTNGVHIDKYFLADELLDMGVIDEIF